jgi:hypothetical protein
MANPELAERWIKGFEDISGRKATAEEEQRIREMADKGLVVPAGPNMKWPTAGEYGQQMLERRRAMWAQIAEHCRQTGKPEPDPAQLAKLEAEYLNSGAPEWHEELARVSVAWAEARESGDPTVLKCETELFMDSIANRKQKGWERLDMMKKWYVANRGELQSPLWQKNHRSE